MSSENVFHTNRANDQARRYIKMRLKKPDPSDLSNSKSCLIDLVERGMEQLVKWFLENSY